MQSPQIHFQPTPMSSNTPKIDNKKLSKILLFTGLGLLAIFIIIRVIFKSDFQEQEKEVVIDDLNYKKEDLPQYENNEERLKAEEKKKENPDPNKDEYINQSFDQAFDQMKGVSPTKTTDKKVENGEKSEGEKENSYQSPYIAQLQKNNREESYQPNYYTPNNYTEPTKNTEIPKEPEKKSPFGTVKIGEKTVSKVNTNYTSFPAVVYGDQNVKDGGSVVLRITEKINYSNVVIPANSILYGRANYSGNRVIITLSKARANNQDIMINFTVNDNDNLPGIEYKAPIDEVKDKASDDGSINIPGNYGQVISKVGEKAYQGAKELVQKSRSLHLEDGYSVFVVPNPNKN